jgi:hypothetical protein
MQKQKQKCCGQTIEVRDRDFTRYFCEVCRKYLGYTKNEYPLKLQLGRWIRKEEEKNIGEYWRGF